jgi:putative oxidoreductase
MSRYAPYLHSLLRIVAGLLFLEHGVQKLFHFPPLPPEMANMHVPDNFKPILMAAGIIELVGGGLITLGLFSRWVAFIAAGEMAVAYWGVHVMRGGFFPATNGGDPAILYCFVFLFVWAAGPGPVAVNQR